MLLGSRIMLQRVTEEDLRERFRAIDDGRSFWEHAEAAGYEPARWRESIHVLDDLVGWIEMHIEQARVLQDTGNRIGVVNAIAGYVHADVIVHGRGDHAGATPMDLRLDPTLVLAETALELERLAREAGQGTVGTIGEIEVDPGLINAIAELACASRSTSAARWTRRIAASPTRSRPSPARQRSARGMRAEVRKRQTLAVTPLDRGIVDALVRRAGETGEPFVQMHSGAAHDTMCVAERVPSAMVFVPVRRRDQPPPGRGRRPGRRRARRRDHPRRDRRPRRRRCAHRPAAARARRAPTARRAPRTPPTPASCANARPTSGVSDEHRERAGRVDEARPPWRGSTRSAPPRP